MGLLGQALWRLESLIYDFRLVHSAPGTTSEHVVIVTIDENSIAQLGIWPWPRGYHARVIDNLAEAGARLIGVDMILSTVSSGDAELEGALEQPLDWEPEPSADDVALAEAIARAGNVVLGITITESQAQQGEVAADIAQADFPYWRFEEAAYAMGVVDMPKDADGPVRRCWLSRTFQDEAWLTMPVVLAAEYRQVDPQSYARQVGQAARADSTYLHGDSFAIAYRGQPGFAFERIPYWQALRGDVTPEQVAGKIVLIGATDPALQDTYDTPLSLGRRPSVGDVGGRQMPGVEVMASATDTMLEDRYIRPASPALPIGLTFLLALGVALAETRLRPLWSLAFVWLPAVVLPFLLALAVMQYWRVWLLMVLVFVAVTLSYVGTTVYMELTTERRRRQLHRSWSQRVSPEVLSVILNNPELTHVEGENITATVVFTDLQGFTTFCHDTVPEQVVETINKYLTSITRAIRKHGGTVHKFIGDGVMATFGAPVPHADHAQRAVLAALDIQQEVQAFAANSVTDCWSTVVRVGIHTGELVAGDIGSEELLEYTVIGDTVSTASRLEGLNKEYGTRIMISRATKEAAGDGFDLQPLGMAEVRGRGEPLEVFAVKGLKQNG
jgi:adenylate cyclase